MQLLSPGTPPEMQLPCWELTEGGTNCMSIVNVMCYDVISASCHADSCT